MSNGKSGDFWLEEDTLAVSASEIENLENDQLSLEEAGFMEGYDEEPEENGLKDEEGDEYGY